uniref:Uncharacterized protein n=1 Tax=Oryza rufipogon TaxID=4529 RepID=A0A0E0PM91_ORYRU
MAGTIYPTLPPVDRILIVASQFCSRNLLVCSPIDHRQLGFHVGRRLAGWAEAGEEEGVGSRQRSGGGRSGGNDDAGEGGDIAACASSGLERPERRKKEKGIVCGR